MCYVSYIYKQLRSIKAQHCHTHATQTTPTMQPCHASPSALAATVEKTLKVPKAHKAATKVAPKKPTY